MAANGIKMSKEVFNDLRDTDSKLDAIFDVLVSVHAQCQCRMDKCDVRFDKIEKRKGLDTAVSAMFGIIGGAAAMLAKWVVGK